MFESDDDFDFGHEWDQAEQRAVEAYEFYEKGQMKEAAQKLDEAIRTGPEHAEWYFNMGLTLDGMEKYEQALDYYQRALEYGPEDVEILNCLGVDYTRTAQYDLALSCFEKAERLDPSFEPAYCNRIIAYTEMEKHDKAEQMFYMAQQIHPDCPLCFYNIGNSLFTQGKYDRALWCWEKCAELEPTHPQIHFRLAQVNWVRGCAARAKEEFLLELRSDPSNLDVLLDFGLFLLESGELESAREKFNRILEFDPRHAPSQFYRGETYHAQGCPKQAVKCYERAVLDDPLLIGPRFRLAEYYLDRHPQRAAELLLAEFALNVEDSDVLMAMGWMFLRIGHLTDASNCFMQVLNDYHLDYRAFWGLAMSLAVHGDYESALDCLRQALALAPDQPDLLLMAGWLCYQLQDWQQALHYAHQCSRLRPTQQPWKKRTQQLQRAVFFQKHITALRGWFASVTGR